MAASRLWLWRSHAGSPGTRGRIRRCRRVRRVVGSPPQFKLHILEEADACQTPGEVGAFLRREGLYSLQLTQWRRARREGSLKAISKPRGPPEGSLWRPGRRRERATAQGKHPVAGVGWNRCRRSSRSKKSLRDPGHPAEPAVGRRRRMIRADEHLAPKVGIPSACGTLGVARASIYRHRKPSRCHPGKSRRAIYANTPTQTLEVGKSP